MNIQLHREEQRIEQMLRILRAQPPGDEVTGMLAQYVCICIAGFIENAMEILFRDYVTRRSTPQIARYISKRFEYGTNWKESKIKGLLGEFSQDWEKQWEDYIDNPKKDAIDSIIANRNNIAHGRPVGITYLRLVDYFKEIRQAIAKIETLLE